MQFSNYMDAALAGRFGPLTTVDPTSAQSKKPSVPVEQVFHLVTELAKIVSGGESVSFIIEHNLFPEFLDAFFCNRKSRSNAKLHFLKLLSRKPLS